MLFKSNRAPGSSTNYECDIKPRQEFGKIFRWELRQQLAFGGECDVRNADSGGCGQDLRVDPRSVEGAPVVHINGGQSRNGADIAAGSLGLAQSTESLLVEQTNVAAAPAGLARLFCPAHLRNEAGTNAM